MFNWFKKKKIQPPTPDPEAEENDQLYSGMVMFYYNKEGDVFAEVDIPDLSNDSASILASLAFLISEGSMEVMVYQAMQAWAELDKDKSNFNSDVAAVVLGMKATSEDAVAVPASQALRGGNQQR